MRQVIRVLVLFALSSSVACLRPMGADQGDGGRTIGRRVVIAHGRTDAGADWVLTVVQSTNGPCIEVGRAAPPHNYGGGCGFDVPEEHALAPGLSSSRDLGLAVDGPVTKEAGGVKIELSDGRRLDATLGQAPAWFPINAFILFLPDDAEVVAVEAVRADGELIERQPVNFERDRLLAPGADERGDRSGQECGGDGIGEHLLLVLGADHATREEAEQSPLRGVGDTGFYVAPSEWYEPQPVAGSQNLIPDERWLLASEFRTRAGAEAFVEMVRTHQLGEQVAYLRVVNVVKRGGAHAGLGHESNPHDSGPLCSEAPDQEQLQNMGCGPDILAEPPPCGKGMELQRSYLFDLPVHCGVHGAYFDGRGWTAVSRPSGDPHNPPAGWDENDERGVVVLRDDDTLDFVSLATKGRAVFKPRPIGQPDPFEGCE